MYGAVPFRGGAVCWGGELLDLREIVVGWPQPPRRAQDTVEAPALLRHRVLAQCWDGVGGSSAAAAGVGSQEAV